MIYLKWKGVLLKRTFQGINNTTLTSEYMISQKYIVYTNSIYHKNTWHADFKTFKTKKEAEYYLFNWDKYFKF